jgi:hypothetical protein
MLDKGELLDAKLMSNMAAAQLGGQPHNRNRTTTTANATTTAQPQPHNHNRATFPKNHVLSSICMPKSRFQRVLFLANALLDLLLLFFARSSG